MPAAERVAAGAVASARAARARRRSRRTGGASGIRSRNCASSSRRWRPRGRPSAPPGIERASPPSPSRATPTPASPACSTASRVRACSSRTRCSRPWTRPCARRARPGGRDYTIADTVGFVRHLPHQLVEAFRSTLEEVVDADLILHVVDGVGRRPGGADRRGARGAERDRRRSGARAHRHQQGRHRGSADGVRPAAPLSARRGDLGADGPGLRRAARRDRGAAADALLQDVDLLIPYSRGDLVSRAHRQGEVLSEPSTTRTGTRLHARVPESLANELRAAAGLEDEGA